MPVEGLSSSQNFFHLDESPSCQMCPLAVIANWAKSADLDMMSEMA
jgi:hypothetical protein